MPALVEHGGDQGKAEHDEQIHRVAQDLPDPAAQPVDGEQPVVHGHHAAGHGHDDGPPEQRAEERSDEVHGALGQQRAPRSQREQRVGLRQGARDAPGGDDAQGKQLRGDEIADLLGVQGPAEVGADQRRDGVRIAGAVDPAGHLVQQRGHLDDLAVGPPDQRRRLAVAGVLVLAEQLDPLGQPGRPGGPGASAGGRTGAVRPVVTCPATAVTGLVLSHVLARDVRYGWARRPVPAQAGGPPGRAALPSCCASPSGYAQQAAVRAGQVLQDDVAVCRRGCR